MFSAAIVVFMLGSILCALAPTVPLLVAARLIQGAGGAMMVPVGRLVLLRAVDKRDLVSAMDWLLTPGLLGPILGPPIGGFIVTYLDWRWIFYLNLPIGLVGLALTWIFIPDVRERSGRRFDARGFLLSAVTLFLPAVRLRDGEPGLGREAPMAILLLIVGFGAGALYLAHARRLKGMTPILDISLMRIPTFRISVLAGSLTRITQGAQPFLLPLMLQIGFGLSAAESGLITLSTACGSATMRSVSAPILNRFGFRTTLIWNSVISSLLFASCALFRPGWPHWAIFGVLLVCGVSMSLQFSAYNVICFDEIPSSRAASANSFYSTFQQLMLSAGICTAATALTGSRLIFAHDQPTLTDFSIAFLIVTAISLIAAPINAALPQGAGLAMTRRRAARRRSRVKAGARVKNAAIADHLGGGALRYQRTRSVGILKNGARKKCDGTEMTIESKITVMDADFAADVAAVQRIDAPFPAFSRSFADPPGWASPRSRGSQRDAGSAARCATKSGLALSPAEN